MDRIPLTAVLAEIDGGGVDRIFSISYVRTDGTKGEKPRVRKSSRPDRIDTGVRFRYRVKETGTLLLVNIDTTKAFSLKICLLTHYNGRRIEHGV